MKKLFLVMIIFLSLIFVTSCKYDNDPYDLIESGDFIYATELSTFGGVEGEVAIIGLTEQGKQKDILVFPNRIDGFKVKQIGGAEWMMQHTDVIEITNAKKVYFCGDYYVKYYIEYINIETSIEIYLSDQIKDGFFEFMCLSKYAKNYISIERLLTQKEEYIKSYNMMPANLSYYVDEVCYFVDYVENDTVKTIPPEPYKEGCIFDGWYKNLEYKEKWNFENDDVPVYNVEYNEDGNPIYKDTKLYAKWIVN